MTDEIVFDFERRNRIGLSEVVYCESKTTAQIAATLDLMGDRALLLTRLSVDKYNALHESHRAQIDFDPLSRTAIHGKYQPPAGDAAVAIITAGTSDLSVAREANRTLQFHGEACVEISDVGVAGLWRILAREKEIQRFPILIVVAGMEGALFSVVGGMVGNPVIAVPTSTGYGVARDGETALHAALASCAPGLVVVNIDNGYGAACAALRVLKSARA